MKFKIQNLIYLILIILLILENQIINSLSITENYPISFLMSNGDIFLITANKIQIFDLALGELKISRDLSSSQITNGFQDAALRNIAQFSDGYIIALVKKTLFVFSQEGICKFEQNLNEDINILSYSLIPYKCDSEYHYYIIAFNKNSRICIQYYKLKIDSSENTLLKEITYTPKDSNGNEVTLTSNGLSCQLMKKNTISEEILACFYELSSPSQLEARLFTIEENQIAEIDLDKVYSTHGVSTTIIKSVVSNDKKKALVCYIVENSYGVCLTYDVHSNEFTSEVKYFEKCTGNYVSMNVYYFQEKDEYMFICNDASDTKGVDVVTFNSNFEASNSEMIKSPNYLFGGINGNINSFDVLYFPPINDYIFIGGYIDYSVSSQYNSAIVNLSKLKGPNSLTSVDLNMEIDNLLPVKPTDKPNEITNEHHTEKNIQEQTNTITELTTLKPLEQTERLTQKLTESIMYNPSSNIQMQTNKITELTTAEKTIEQTEKMTQKLTELYYSDSLTENNFITNEKTNNDNSNIIIQSSSKTKEEIIKDLNNLISDKIPDKTYLLEGEDYTLIIKPINEKVEESTVNIDFSECEKLLKEIYPTKQFRILQINIENPNKNCLTDQVEYKIYDEDGQEIELSICKDVTIKIEYEIKDASILDIEQISDLKEKGIDAFDIKSDFFNDICYSYSDGDSGSDMILSDRVSDLYQNYSLCGEGCTYDSFNIDTMSAYCNCDVKQEVSTEVEEGKFENYIASAFLDSNFGVIKCYKIVFSIEGKLKNVGFWIFSILVISHFPINIFYFMKGTNPVEKYINQEMDDKGYISKSKNNKRKIKASKSSKSLWNKSKKNRKNKKSKNKSSNNENNNPPLKSGKKKRNLNEKNKLKLKIDEDNKDYKSPYDKKYKKNISRMKDLNTINSDEIQTDNNYENENQAKEKAKKLKKSKNLKKFSKKNFNNLITELESNEILNENKKINFKKKIKSDKNVLKHMSLEKIKEKNKDTALNKKVKKNRYSLIIINADNTGNHHPLKSNYILNNYDYEEAVKYDKRSFLRVFFIYLISKDNILNLIFFNPPLELKPLRLCIFIFSYSCDFALNALFYLSDNISEKYHYTGASRELFALINNLTISLVSTIVSYILLYFFQSLTQSSDKIEDIFKDQENLLKADKKYKVNEITKRKIEDDLMKIIKCLKIKIICFIIFEFLFMLFFFYYVTAFCQVYQSTQISWLLDCISSYFISLLISLLLSLICSFLYKVSIKYQRKILYKIVLFIYSFC
mgnify:CR=1 FL=1